MKSRLGREYVGGAPNADGNQCRCILVRFSSLSIGAPMRIAGAVIVGSSTRTTGVREPKSEIEEGTTGETREMCGCEDFQLNKFSAMARKQAIALTTPVNEFYKKGCQEKSSASTGG